MSDLQRVECDVAVVGAGPAGLASAAVVAEGGRSVILIDDNPHVGGQIWRHSIQQGIHANAKRLVEKVTDSGVEFLGGLTIFDASPHTLWASSSDGDVTRVMAKTIILATGAIERFIPFPGWTLPGNFGVGGLQAMVKGGFEISGKRVILAGSGPLLLAVASSLKKRGAHVVGLVEQASKSAVVQFGMGLWTHPKKLIQSAALLSRLSTVRKIYDAWPLRANGSDHVESLTIRAGNRIETHEVDIVASGFGLVPHTRLARLLGCAADGDRVRVNDSQKTSIDDVFCVGESTGIGGVHLSLAEGSVAGYSILGNDAKRKHAIRMRVKERAFADRLERTFDLRDELRHLIDDETIVCRCEDVRWSSIRLCDDSRQAKLETRCGMGPCQGRVCGTSLEFIKAWRHDRVRPPLIPIPMRALASIPNTEEMIP